MDDAVVSPVPVEYPSPLSSAPPTEAPTPATPRPMVYLPPARMPQGAHWPAMHPDTAGGFVSIQRGQVVTNPRRAFRKQFGRLSGRRWRKLRKQIMQYTYARARLSGRQFKAELRAGRTPQPVAPSE